MELLHAVFNHLVMPPHLPGRQDTDIEAISRNVLMRIIRACEAVDALASPPWSEAFQSLLASLNACFALNQGRLDRSTMLEHFHDLQPNHMLILHVVQQNAALLVQRESCDGQHHVVFEAFETSASSEQVIAAPWALQWDFPGRAAQMPLDNFADEPFQEGLAAFLEQASVESLYSLQAHTRKANVSVTEARDTTDPALITQMLIPLLEAIGTPFQAPVLRKRIRDDVNIRDAELPWRRLPFWLVLRVAAQRQLSHSLGNEQGRIGYKLLMCILLAELLKESAGKLDPELTITLRAKLCRRMAKLKIDRTKAESTNVKVYEYLFGRIDPVIKAVIEEATAQVEAAWRSFKQATTRRIPKLPLRASNHALQLSLVNSGGYLDDLLTSQFSRQAIPPSFNLPHPLDKAIKQTQDFTNHVFRLADMEVRVDQDKQPEPDTTQGYEDRSLQLAGQIYEVFTQVGTAYDSDPEQMSAMILALFTLWARLDEVTVAACPLLRDHYPVFRPELLDVLQLPTFSSMRRLQDIQTYLSQRHSGSRFRNILGGIDTNCLAVRYAAQSNEMQSLGVHIQNASDQARDTKEAEWKRICKEYDDLTKKIQGGTCHCTPQRNGTRDVRGCTKCWHWRVRSRMQIQVHEAFLPENDPARSAVIFELAIPSYLAAYRNATWQILSVLAHPSRSVKSSCPEMKLTDSSPLQRYMMIQAQNISLASTIKCFIQTHYKFKNGKVPLDRVVLPLAARFELYDPVSGLWVKDLCETLTLQHICGIHVPRALEATISPVQQHPPPDADGPSSYEIQANQSECPSNMSIHEFSAYQKLLAGKTRRWPNIIVEMGSSNLNFSSEDTMRVLCQLAVQAGPQLAGEVLRAAHVVFKEPAFLERLVDTIEKRLEAIQGNWREHNSLELLITLSLRLFQLSSGSARAGAEALLQTARDASLDWIARLCKEVGTTVDADAVRRATTYGFYAALLCRRTFTMYIELDRVMSKDDLTSWIQASVALQENLLVDIKQLPHALKSMLIRDAKMAHRLESLLRQAIEAHPASVGDGIARSWDDSLDKVTIFSSWTFLPPPHGRWIVATTSQTQDRSSFSQMVHHNIVEGHLLVNGRPRGKLPLEIRDSTAVKEMFGNQHLLTYPSSLPDMTHRLVSRVHGQEVHFGLRNDQVIIRTLTKNDLLEFVSREVFTGPDSFDLPAELVDNCVHWLNLNTKCLEIRRAPAIWVKRPRDWVVDVPGRRATRGNVNLVDPRSDMFSQITGILRHFERPERLTVYQPRGGSLSIELRHLELSFHVNAGGRLQCRQLQAEVDTDQDAGTWYGLQSKIVLREIISQKRSIIVPLGEMEFKRQGMHVDVRMRSAHDYGRYRIDEVMCRVSCPPEPRLLYTKALCHAATSFCLPDPLTGRTGTEEAFFILQSGAGQPWAPLGDITHPIFAAFKALLPRREYYPPEIKRLQRVTWDENLTTSIQHDGYESLTRDIMERSNRLNKFVDLAGKDFDIRKPTHLRYRGELHRRLYERPALDAVDQVTEDQIYIPRDRKVTPKAANVYRIARLILGRCSTLHMNTTLQSVLESWQVIGGFCRADGYLPARKPLISQIEEPIDPQWGDLVNFCRQSENAAPLLFRFGLLAFGPSNDMDAIYSLTAFAFIDELKKLKPPVYARFVDFKSRGRPSFQVLEKLIVRAHCVFARGSPREAAHQENCQEEGGRLAFHFLEQWPNPAGKLSLGDCETQAIDVFSTLEKVKTEWARRRENEELESYINQVQAILDSRNGSSDTLALSEWTDEKPVLVRTKYPQITLGRDLVENTFSVDTPVPDILPEAGSTAMPDITANVPAKEFSDEFMELGNILDKFANSTDVLRQQYSDDLLQSLSALKDMDQILQMDQELPVPALEDVTRATAQARAIMACYLERTCTALAAFDRRSNWLQLGSMWPCTAPAAVLGLLRSTASYNLGTGMKEALVAYGLAVTALQRLERIRCALLLQDKLALDEELRNPGHKNWSPLDVPAWLLLEIDGNCLIRAEQVDVAQAIITPASGRNSVLQMNMGKGKTSFVVPMVVAVLGDGKNLTRLIVPKALLMQTAQTAQSRLGGLVGRAVCHVPFSRKTPTTPAMLELYKELHYETRGARGLIISSHEHILSYKLGGWQHLADGRLEVASGMTNFQNWLNDHCRDILDECDFTLSVKTQLNYPGGTEMTVDGHPFRWRVAQGLLASTAYYIPNLRDRFPESIEVLERSGSFPIVHFLKSDVEDGLHDCIVDDICAGRTMFLRPANSSSSSLSSRRGTIRRVLSEQKSDGSLLAQAADAFENPQVASKMLLAVRGLLVNRILLLCLGKQWNVQYGLHQDRHPIAVPFEAKGVPSEQSEFGHPDVAILLTCLAFYYTGLTSKQFCQGLQQVLQSDDPATQYEWWTSGCDHLPEALHHWNAINIDDEGQVEELWQHLHVDRTVIDHYMNYFVFPVHAKQFDVKLQASAWDIPLFSKEQQTGAQTTGFSGTNDNRMLLPLTIQQDDLASLRQTSAEVLSYLLQPRNRAYQVIADSRSKRLTEADLLHQLHAQGIRILIDAGPYILAMDNKTLAKKWLAIDHTAKAAIYFGSDNRAWVHFRGETKNDVPLLATPFLDNLGECIVYLDHAHTRGVDLKLPRNARGALTLALRQTKDYTVQAAMRLRQLRTTQSVTFFAPPEVDQSIKDFCRVARNQKLDSSYVVHWLLEQTCLMHESLNGLYVAQGIDFCQRTDAAWRHHDFLINPTHRAELLEVLRQPERQTLEQLYGTASESSVIVASMSARPLQAFADQLALSTNNRGAIQTCFMEEVEQEREVQFQVEQVRQVQKPLRYEALSFPGLHPTLSNFARTGVLETELSLRDRPGFEHAFVYIAKTSLGRRFGVRDTGSRLFVSKEFGKTVKSRGNGDAVDNFLRPVEWILWSPSTQTALVLIPEEAELLIHTLRLTADKSNVHLIAYAAPTTRAMLSFSHFQYYNLPRLPEKHSFPEWFRIELGILAGLLYVDSAESVPLARYLQPQVEATGSASNGDSGLKIVAGASLVKFANNPTDFVLEWLVNRRKAQNVLHTPMGYICIGRPLGKR